MQFVVNDIGAKPQKVGMAIVVRRQVEPVPIGIYGEQPVTQVRRWVKRNYPMQNAVCKEVSHIFPWSNGTDKRESGELLRLVEQRLRNSRVAFGRSIREHAAHGREQPILKFAKPILLCGNGVVALAMLPNTRAKTNEFAFEHTVPLVGLGN